MRQPSLCGRLLALCLLVALAGCGLQSPTPSPTPPASPSASSPASAIALPSPVLGLDWGRATSVERPEEAFAQPSPGASIPFSLGVGRSGHPLHFPGQAIMADVASVPSGGLVSVGYVHPGWHPAAWTSGDGQSWALQDMGSTEFTFPVAVTVGSDGTIVAVGRSGPAPVDWTSRDGRSWQPHSVATLGDGATAERMTAVIAVPGGYLAGGSAGPELLDRHARFWRSTDGATWTPVEDDPEAFANSEVRAIARHGDVFVAIGTVGSIQEVTGSVAWVSEDGERWARIDDEALKGGRAVALAEAPFGGLVAVGSDVTEDEAFAWISEDGRSWTRAPSEPSRQYHGKIRMTDVAVVGDELVGVGNYVGLQRGTAISWVSRDGLHWEQSQTAPIQEQVELYAVVPAGPGVVAVGSFGAPDDYIPVVLLSPAR
jgi:hypothetical protein